MFLFYVMLWVFFFFFLLRKLLIFSSLHLSFPGDQVSQQKSKKKRKYIFAFSSHQAPSNVSERNAAVVFRTLHIT